MGNKRSTTTQPTFTKAFTSVFTTHALSSRLLNSLFTNRKSVKVIRLKTYYNPGWPALHVRHSAIRVTRFSTNVFRQQSYGMFLHLQTFP
jgi:hypothetical protein